MAKQGILLSIGVGSLALAAIAASQTKPIEAPLPEHGVPAAQNVEPVLRATYVLPSGRSEPLAAFLKENAAPGIDVRLEEDRLIVVAPADVQKALGGFVEKCLSKEPNTINTAPYHFDPDDKGGNNTGVPNYSNPNDGFFREPTLAPPATRVPSRTNPQPNDGFFPSNS